MIDDVGKVADGGDLQADLCVVGAGAAGIALAREFLGTDVRVVLLESGGMRPDADAAALNEGEATGIEAESLTAGRERVLGGTTALWAGQCLRPEPNTFDARPWVPHSGWPFGEPELNPFLRRAERLFQIEGEVYDERVWDSFGVTRPDTDPERMLHRFTVWCPQPHLGRLYRGELSRSGNVRVLLHATATGIGTNADGTAFDHVRVATREGRSVRVRARTCVLSGGAIENARLLLASDVGNRYDVVGRYFQDHPNSHCAVIAPQAGARLQDLYAMLYRRGTRYLPRLVLSERVQEHEGVLSCAAYPVFHYGEGSGIEALRRIYRSVRSRRRPEGLRRDLGRLVRDAPQVASIARRRAFHGRTAGVEPALITLHVHAEQAPNPDSRVTLSGRRDRFGERLPKVDWRLTELDRRTAATMVAGAAEELGRIGLGDVRPEPWLAGEGWTAHVSDAYHHIGTTRLGTDPRTSVVDPDGQVHGVAGLHVAGSSVFPAAGFANPTLTLAALAIRLADHCKRALGRPAGT